MGSASISWHIEKLMAKLGTETPKTAVTRWHALARRAEAARN
jgi:hypothetical protein